MKISIVTPSYNQSAFLETAMKSVLDQNYHSIEYILVEDGSTDESPAIAEKFRDRLTHYISGPNRGFGEALNDGLKRCTGDIMAWINADDFYMPWAFSTVARVFEDCPEVDWLAGCSLICSASGNPISLNHFEGFGRTLFFSGRYLGGHQAWGGKWIPQESVFWRRSLWENAGGEFCRERLQYGDFELWTRFWRHAPIYQLPVILGAYRCHPLTYTAQRGSKSLGPCTALLEASGQPTFRLYSMRLRNALFRMNKRLFGWLGDSGGYLEFDMKCNRWKSGMRRVM